MIGKRDITVLFFSVYFLISCLYPSIAKAEMQEGMVQVEPPQESSAGYNENPADIQRLLRYLGERASGIQSIRTDFVQEKNLAIFRNKIILRGGIYLQKPDRLAWKVDSPTKYAVVFSDKSIRQWDEETDEIHDIPLSGNTVFQNIIAQLTVWFSGKYISLLDEYDARILNRNPYVLEFHPKDSSITSRVIKSITVSLREDERYLKRIEFREVSGDSTVIMLKNTVLNAPLDDSDFEVKQMKTEGKSSRFPAVAVSMRTAQGQHDF